MWFSPFTDGIYAILGIMCFCVFEMVVDVGPTFVVVLFVVLFLRDVATRA